MFDQLIKHYKQFCKLTNNSTGGEVSALGCKRSPEVLKKMSEISKNLWKTKLRDIRCYKVRAINQSTGQEIVFKNKHEASSYIGCNVGSVSTSSVKGTTIFGWKMKMFKD